MKPRTTGVRPRTLLVAALSGVLAMGVAPATAAPAAPVDPRIEARHSLLDRAAGTDSAALRPAKQPNAKQKATKQPDSSEATTSDKAAPSARGGAELNATAAAAASCADLDTRVTQTLDHNHVTWNAVAGATSYSVQRQRRGGAVRTIASGLSASTTSFEDAGHNPLGSVAYTVTAAGAGGSCRSPEGPDDWWTMSTADGVGYPDVFFSGTDAVWEQDTYGSAAPAWSAAARTPAFSSNGRLVAAVEQVGGVWSITVRHAATGALQWSAASPDGTVLDEPAFSPDGQRIVTEALDATDLNASTGLYTVPVNTPTHPLTFVPGSAGLATADWVDTPGVVASTTIVAADIAAPGGLLTLVDAATGARTPVPGTAGALDPMGQADGSILFTTLSDTAATLDRRNADGSVVRIKTWADSIARWPVTDPDTGDVLLYLEVPDPADPAETLWSVSGVDPLTGTTEITPIGVPRSGVGVGFSGFDLRTPVSAGTSNFGGSANGEILARSSTGILYGYPLSASGDRFFDARRQIGSGWGIMKQFIAAGDFTSDRRGDIIAIDTTGSLWLYPGKGSFGLGARTRLGTGWSSYAIFSTGDFNGDTRADLIARDSAGVLWMYPGNGRGGLSPRTQIGKGWSIFNAIVGPGDWDYDGKADLLARDRATGYLYLYPGKGNGGFLARKYLGSGWNGRNGFAAPEFYQGFNALFARTTTGVLLDYDSVGDGVMSGSAVYQAGSGWSPFTITG